MATNTGAPQRGDTVPAAPYTARPPSPPPIMIPGPEMNKGYESISCVPRYANVDPQFLSPRDLEIITGNRPQEAHDTVSTWKYEDRRKAQPIIDFMWLGPSSVARDKQFLQENGFTMLLGCRDSRMAQLRLMAVDRVAKELGIYADYVDVSDHQEFISKIPAAISKINDHMLQVFRSNSVALADNDVSVAADPRLQAAGRALNGSNHPPVRGKVLIFCETGNDRSAGLVIAYLMSVYGMSMIQACQFIQFRRFCVGLDDEMKFLMQTYGDIISAQKMVHRQQLNHPLSPTAPQDPTKSKRRVDDIMDEDDMVIDTGDSTFDRDRYMDRPAFVPFVDVPNDIAME